jgi:hypothetical protein
MLRGGERAWTRGGEVLFRAKEHRGIDPRRPAGRYPAGREHGRQEARIELTHDLPERRGDSLGVAVNV